MLVSEVLQSAMLTVMQDLTSCSRLDLDGPALTHYFREHELYQSWRRRSDSLDREDVNQTCSLSP